MLKEIFDPARLACSFIEIALVNIGIQIAIDGSRGWGVAIALAGAIMSYQEGVYRGRRL